MRWRIYPRHRLDLKTGHLLRALLACVHAEPAERLERTIELDMGRDAIVCASVRSGLELLLEALAEDVDAVLRGLEGVLRPTCCGASA